MRDRSNELLKELAHLAANVGPAVAPSGHAELLQSITSAAREIFGAAACSVALLDEETGELVFHVASGAGQAEVVGLRVPAGRGVAGWVLASGQPIAIEDVSQDPRFAADVAESTGYTPRSILAMPLETDRQMVGVIEILDRRGGPEGQKDMELLSLFARQAALAIENSRAFSDLARVLFEAAAAVVRDDTDLATALREIAAKAPGPEASMAQLAAELHGLGRIGEVERATALRLIEEFVTYLRSKERLP